MIKSMCFLATYNCTAACDFCECGPKNRDRLSIQTIKRLINEGCEIGTIGQVVFSGGEPTLLGEDLFEAIRYSEKKGLLTRVVTNGWWGKSQSAADEFVNQLVAAGLHEINISVDDWHQRWVNIERVRHSFLACYGRRLKCLIAHKRSKISKITRTSLTDFFGVELLEYDSSCQYSEEEQFRLFSSGVVIPVGRGEGNARMSDLLVSQWWGSCSSILRDIIVGAKGNLLPCCGIIRKNIPELTRDDLTRTPLLSAIESANNDLMLNWIALEAGSDIGCSEEMGSRHEVSP